MVSSMTRVPSLEQLLALTRTAAHGSLGEAGRELGVSQQAMSVRVRAAEKLLGVTVFERSSVGVRPTGQGRLVLAWANDVVEAARVLDTGAEGLRTARQQVRVAASSTISEILLPTLAARLRGDHPEVSLHVIPGNSQAVVAAVLQGEADLGYVEGPSVPRSVRSRIIAHDELVVVVPPDHPWARRRRGIDRDELARTPLVLREPGSGTRRHLEQVLTDHVDPVQTLESNAAVRDAARTTGAPTVLSTLAVAGDLNAGRLVQVPVTDLRLPRALRVIWHPYRRPSGPAADLLRLSTRGT